MSDLFCRKRKEKYCLIHFFHPDFSRCRIMDSRLDVRPLPRGSRLQLMHDFRSWHRNILIPSSYALRSPTRHFSSTSSECRCYHASWRSSTGGVSIGQSWCSSSLVCRDAACQVLKTNGSHRH